MSDLSAVAYLDHAASTPMRAEAVEAMARFADVVFANPSGAHGAAREARRAVEEARELIAEALGARPAEVVFTSGGTEADNLAALGTLALRTGAGARASVVCSAIEHEAVLSPLRAAARGAAAVLGVGAVHLDEAGVTPVGIVDLDALAGTVGEDTALVSVMTANNETGAVQPIGAVADLVRKLAPRAVLHTDAVQAAAYLDLAEIAAPCDLVSVSAHKLGGPKGVGALVVRSPHSVAPLLHGGGQEQERRSGTHNVAGVVGFAAALAAAVEEQPKERTRVARLRDRLADAVAASIEGVVESVPRELTLPGHLHLRFAGVDQEELLVLLDQGGVYASAASACASGALEPSHVLLAMGLDPVEARSGVRFSLGRTTSEADVSHALVVLVDAVKRLRAG